jgi:hypothetical protein
MFAVMTMWVMSGCSVTPSVTKLDNDRYTVGANSSAPESARTSALKQATEYCASKGQTMDAQSFSEESARNVYRENVVFACNCDRLTRNRQDRRHACMIPG